MMRRAVVAVALLAAAAMTTAAHAQPAGWKPSRPVELVAPSAAGGGSDTLARLVQKLLQEGRLTEAPLTVINKPQAGGVIAWTGLNQNPNDGHHLAISTVNLLTNHITGRTPLNYTDFSAIAQLFSETVGIAVRADSPLKSGRDLVAQMKQDPGALSAAIGTSLGNSGHVALALVARAAGSDAKKLRAVVFPAASQGITALLGGHVDLVASPASNLLPHQAAGKLRIIAISAPQRQSGALAGVPTLREQGANVIVDNLRGVIGPKAMTAAQVAYWESVLARMVTAAEWKEHLDKNVWTDSYVGAAGSLKALAEQYEEMRVGLKELGLAK